MCLLSAETRTNAAIYSFIQARQLFTNNQHFFTRWPSIPIHLPFRFRSFTIMRISFLATFVLFASESPPADNAHRSGLVLIRPSAVSTAVPITRLLRKSPPTAQEIALARDQAQAQVKWPKDSTHSIVYQPLSVQQAATRLNSRWKGGPDQMGKNLADSSQEAFVRDIEISYPRERRWYELRPPGDKKKTVRMSYVPKDWVAGGDGIYRPPPPSAQVNKLDLTPSKDLLPPVNPRTPIDSSDDQIPPPTGFW